MWYRATAFMFLAALPFLAQDTLFDKAPPAIDRALRERVAQFYDAHVEKKTVKVFSMVAEDSQQVFFDMEKPFMRGYEIKHIKYADDYTKAAVILSVDTDLVMLGFGKHKVIMPLQSKWKLVDGQWMWFVEPYDSEKGVETAFGSMQAKDANEASADPRQAVAAAMASAPTLDKIQSTVKVTANQVDLSSHEPSSFEIVLTNTFQGKVQLELEVQDLPGLSVKLDKNELEQGQQAKLSFAMKPQGSAKKPGRHVRVRVSPTRQIIDIPVRFAIPPLEATLKQP